MYRLLFDVNRACANQCGFLSQQKPMQIKELKIPPNHKKITYQIGKNGKTVVHFPSTSLQINSFQNWQGCRIELGQLNSIHLTPDNQFQNILRQNPYREPVKEERAKTSTCNCKKSKCLKMYCECFSKGQLCSSDCSCKGCANTEHNEKKLTVLRQEAEGKKITGNKGCRCAKSNCQKKYCQCYSRGEACSTQCACLNCQNNKNINRNSFD